MTSSLLGAQDSLLRCELIAQEEGLPDNSAWSLCEDHLGLLWIGTQLGLARYDGHTIEAFHFEPPDSVFQKKMPINVRTLMEGPSGDLWIGTAHGEVFRFDRQTHGFIPYFIPSPQSINAGPQIQSILVDSYHQVWLARGAAGLVRLQASAKDIPWQEAARTPWQSFPQQGSHSPGRIVWDLTMDQHGSVWAATDRGLARWEEKEEQFQVFSVPEHLTNRKNLRLLSLDTAPDGSIWLAAPGAGLIHFFPDQQRFELHSVSEENLVFKVYFDSQGILWFFETHHGTEHVSRYDPVGKKVNRKKIWHSRHSATSNYHSLKAIIEDRNGLLWIADHFSGLLKHRTDATAFQWIQHDPANPNSLSSNAVSNFLEDSRGQIWIATRGEGLDRWDRRSNTFTHFRHRAGDPGSLSSDGVLSLAEDKQGRLWIGTRAGIDRYDPLTNTLERFNEQKNIPVSLKNIDVTHLLLDEQGGCWIAHLGSVGLQYYNPISGVHLQGDDFGALADGLESTKVDELFLDSDGKLWVGTNNDGFYWFNPETRETKKFNFPPGGDFWEDEQRTVWVGTYGAGLVGVEMHDLSWRQFRPSDGLPHNKVRSIMHDQSGRLWIGTNHGLSHFDPRTGLTKNFYVEDGLPSNEFMTKSHLKLKDGHLLFGTRDGLIFFHPDSIDRDTARPEVVLLELHIGGLPLAETKNDDALSDFSAIRRLKLNYDQNDVAFRYAAMNFRNPKRNRYQVRLEPYDEGWQEAGNRTSYTNLDPNQYVFRVKAANSDGTWNDQAIALAITILPPWWKTGWAYAFYVLCIGLILSMIYQVQLQRKLERAETHRIKELNDFKSRFYTNITHEFRTPLAVILGMADQMEQNPGDWFREGLRLIRRNSNKLLRLVNQMLDLRKLESGKLPVRMVQGDVISYLQYIVESFSSLADTKDIRLHFLCPPHNLMMDYDPEKLHSIVSNLLSNAIKFTPEGGDVYLQVEKREAPTKQQPSSAAESGILHRARSETASHHLLLTIKDTGIGIPKDKLPHIFDRFYQGESSTNRRGEGTGIGLALTKELIKLLGGSIAVESTVNKGTTFTLWLPMSQEAEKEPPLEREPAVDRIEAFVPVVSGQDMVRSAAREDGALPLVLLVEDNEDVLRYLQVCLQANYRLAFARNGREGIDQALELVPDVILSDVMMPEVDGFELCDTLKKDVRTSHIPIILLTAKADQASKIEGLKEGADAYLTKPFDKEELFIRLEKLIELRQHLQERHDGEAETARFLKPGSSSAYPRENAFLQQIKEKLVAHIDEQDFGIPELCDALSMSRTQLHRKIKALTGKSTSIYLRSLRLAKARELLENTDLNISEVSYEVGFRSPNYFSQAFSEEYGVPPSAVKKG